MLEIVLIAMLVVAITLFVMNFLTGEKRIEMSLRHVCSVAAPQFRREMGTLLGPAIIDGNRVDNLENGAEIFPAMLAAIRSARHTITFETYIYWSGDIGQTFAQALADRSAAGVKVHVLLDWLGSQKMEEDLVKSMQDAGIEVHRYHRLHWFNLARMNNRTHRKLLVIDGNVGFTGGVGIADQWDGQAQDEEHWRDSHYRLQGPAVGQMQAAFMDNWIKASGQVLQGEGYFPALQPAGPAMAQVFTSSPVGGGDSMQLMYLLAISAAAHSLDLSAAYFVPDPLTRRALVTALKRGVRVRIIVPGPRIDAQIVRKASRAHWGELLAAGASIHEYQPTMFHCKMLIVDTELVSVGSTNFDNRSFRLNDEANLNVYNVAMAQRLTRVFDADLQHCRRITHEMWRRRPWQQKLGEWVSSLFAAQL